MKTLIIEDEAPAARKLVKLLEELEPDMEVLDILDSVQEGIEWLTTNEHPDLIFSDIHLADGESFLIFEEVFPKCPIIFTTAFDQYAIRAFEVNSVDYLLKPFSAEQLKNSLVKFKERVGSTEHRLQTILDEFSGKKAKQRFLISKGDSLIPVNSSEIAYVFTEDKSVMIKTFEGNKYFINYTLDEVEQQLDELQFFRLNRQVICNLSSIAKISNYFNGKLKVELKPSYEGELVVSRTKASVFKSWLER